MDNYKPDLKPIEFAFSKISEGYAYCRILTDKKGEPIDWVYIEVNDAYEQINGVKRVDVVGKKATEVLPAIRSDPGDWIKLYGKVALTGEPIITERYAEVRHKWYHVSAYSPQKGYFVAIFEDITERKKVEESMKQTATLFSKAFNESPVATAITRLSDGCYVDVNDTFLKIFGYLKNEVIGHTSLELNIFTDAGGRKTFLELLQKTGHLRNVEMTFRSKTGRLIPCMISTEKITINDGEHLLTTLVDISDRKRAEQALRESEKRWSTTLSSIGDAVIATDIVGRITFMNPVAEQLTGWLLEEAKSKPIKEVFNIFNEQTRAEVESPVTKVLQLGLIVGLANHTVLIRKDGTEVAIDDSGAPIVKDDGVIQGVVLVFRDITERKKAEELLKEQASLINLSPDGILIKKIDDTITFWNEGAERLYGWTKEEAIGRKSRTLFQTKFPEPYEDILNRLKSQGLWTGEKVHTKKSGQQITVSSRWLARKNSEGQILEILETNEDITERKKAMQEIAEAKQRLDAHMNNAPVAVIEFDSQLKVIRWSEQATKIFGWTKDEILGKTISEMPWVYKDDTKVVQKISADMIMGNRPSNVSHNRNLRKDGSVIECDWYNSAIYNSKGHLVSILSEVIDVTEQKRAEKEIVRLASYPTLNPNPVLEVDSDGKVTYANPATTKLFPTLESEGLNHIFFNDWESIKKVFCDRDVQTFSREIEVNDHWYQQQFYRVPNTEQIRIYTTDINELKQTEQARAKAQTKIEEYANQMEELAEQRAQQLKNAERLAAIGQTAGMVGHDIRNPLQAITGDMYLINEELKTLAEGDCKQAILESVESVNRNLIYINKIVSDLQDYTRPLTPNLQNANLPELVEGTLATIIIPKGIEVITDIKETAKPIKTDPAFMRRMLTNLVTNAVQAMQEEGKLTIKASKHKNTIVLSVEDTGIGIPDEVKAKMFTPLFTTKSKGQGLGLAVVKRLVEALGGSIMFESDTGKGTKFTVELPQK